MLCGASRSAVRAAVPMSDSEMSSMFVYEISRKHVPDLQQLIWCPCFSHAQTLRRVTALLAASQGRCLCTVLLCRGRLVPLGLRTLIPLPFLEGEGQCSANVPFCVSGPGPSSLSARHSSCLQPANTTALECENLKTKRPPKEPFETCCKMSKSQRP